MTLPFRSTAAGIIESAAPAYPPAVCPVCGRAVRYTWYDALCSGCNGSLNATPPQCGCAPLPEFRLTLAAERIAGALERLAAAPERSNRP